MICCTARNAGVPLTAKDERLLDALLKGPEQPGVLARASLLVGQHAQPGLDVERYMAGLEEDIVTLRLRMPKDASRSWVIGLLNRFLFEERGYRGNQENYYDPRNSLLHSVIDRRLGIPITLSILYLELGWGLGLPLQGVAFPGHFLVKCPMERGMVILDPFHGGVSLSEAGLRDRLQQQGLDLQARPDVQDWLQLADRRAILSRLLRNLKRIYMDGANLADAIQVLSLLLVVEPGAARELRDRGNLYRRMECWGAAVADLEAALATGGLEAEDAEDTRQSLVELRARPRLLH